MAKSALDKFKALPAKKLIEYLDCPHMYGLVGAYTQGNSCAIETAEPVGRIEGFIQSYCKTCWTKKI